MTSIDALMRAINYIEMHLQDEIQLQDIAYEAGYSLYHFHRLFKSVVKDSLKDYIRKRQMSEAAKDLVYSNEPIIDIAIRYHYESREAFSRAFQKSYGCLPSHVRQEKKLYSLREKLNREDIYHYYTQNESGLTPEIVWIESQTFYGEKIRVKSDGSNLKEIPLFWSQWHQRSSSSNTNELYGVCIFQDSESFDYLIASEESASSHSSVYSTKPCLYAVFKVEGPMIESIQKTWDSIYTHWLVNSNYQHLKTHDIEKYYHHDNQPYVELYMPITKK